MAPTNAAWVLVGGMHLYRNGMVNLHGRFFFDSNLGVDTHTRDLREVFV